MSRESAGEFAIETSNLTKTYGDTTALAGIDLRVEAGEVFGFLGPNGAGKTTTIDILLDFIRPTDGSATVLGYDTQASPQKIRPHVGILPDGFDLWSRSSGYRHLEFAIESVGSDDDPDDLLERVGLDGGAASRRVGNYSKGMLQRLGMALALVGDPQLLILDEPSSGLDPHGIRLMQSIVREEAASGTTVFFSSHILGQVSAVCDRVGILDSGQLVTVDTIDGLRERAGIGSTLVMEIEDESDETGTIGDGPEDRFENSLRDETDLVSVAGVTSVEVRDGRLAVGYATERAKANIIHAVVDSGLAVTDFQVEEATLDALFKAFTGENADTWPPDTGSNKDEPYDSKADGPTTERGQVERRS